MNVVDSSGWLEYFAAGHNVDFFAGAIEKPEKLIVPTISIYEVFKHFLVHRTEQDGLQAITLMRQGLIVDLTVDLSLSASRLGKLYKLPLADSIILATATSHGATLWTQDADFETIPGVKHTAKRKTTAAR